MYSSVVRYGLKDILPLKLKKDQKYMAPNGRSVSITPHEGGNQPCYLVSQTDSTRETLPGLRRNMAAQDVSTVPAVGYSGVCAPPPAVSANTASPGTDGWQHGSQSDAEKQFFRCASRIRALRADPACQHREELNLLFDELLSENYNKTFYPNINIQTEVTDS